MRMGKGNRKARWENKNEVREMVARRQGDRLSGTPFYLPLVSQQGGRLSAGTPVRQHSTGRTHA